MKRQWCFIPQKASLFDSSVRTHALHVFGRFEVVCDAPALLPGSHTFELVSNLGSHSVEALRVSIKESPFHATVPQDCYVGSICDVVFVSPVPWDSDLECNFNSVASNITVKSYIFAPSTYKCTFISLQAVSKVMLINSVSGSVLATAVLTSRHQSHSSIHSISIQPTTFSASSSILLTIFGFGLSQHIKCILGDRFELAVIEQSPSQAVLLLETPLMIVSNFTFSCQGGYSTRVSVEVPDALSQQLSLIHI